jgi:hypothetical protein
MVAKRLPDPSGAAGRAQEGHRPAENSWLQESGKGGPE